MIPASMSRHWKATRPVGVMRTIPYSEAGSSVLRIIRLALVHSTLVSGGFFTFVKRSNLLGSEGIAVDEDIIDAAVPFPIGLF